MTDYTPNPPKAEPGMAPWCVMGKGWTLITEAEASQRRSDNAASFTRAALAAQAKWEATSKPTRWPVRHRALLAHLRSKAKGP